MRRNGAKSWLDFWNGDKAIYACDRHKELHYEAVARDLSAHIPSPDALALDYGCGEALSAAAMAIINTTAALTIVTFRRRIHEQYNMAATLSYNCR